LLVLIIRKRVNIVFEYRKNTFTVIAEINVLPVNDFANIAGQFSIYRLLFHTIPNHPNCLNVHRSSEFFTQVRNIYGLRTIINEISSTVAHFSRICDRDKISSLIVAKVSKSRYSSTVRSSIAKFKHALPALVSIVTVRV
jgi:hypothetical protein